MLTCFLHATICAQPLPLFLLQLLLSETGNSHEQLVHRETCWTKAKISLHGSRGGLVVFFFTYKKEDTEASKGSQCSWQWGISLLENILSSPSQFYKTEQKAKPGYENWETGTVLNIYIFFQFFSRVEPSCGASGSHIETEVQTINNIVQANHILPLSFLRGMQRW